MEAVVCRSAKSMPQGNAGQQRRERSCRTWRCALIVAPSCRDPSGEPPTPVISFCATRGGGEAPQTGLTKT